MLLIVARSSRRTLSRSSASTEYRSATRSADPERVQDLEPDPALLVQGLDDVPLQLAEAAELPEPFALGRVAIAQRLRLLRQQRGDREDLRLEAEQALDVVLDEARSPAGPTLRSRRRSTLLTMMTIFLPHSRISAMNSRSLSVNGRSAEVTKRTRSERGTNRSVSCSCSRMMALVPGVSTTVISSRNSAG